MTPFDRQQIEAWIESRTGDINLGLIADGSEQAKPLSQFCDELTGMGSSVKIKKRAPDSAAEYPAILVGSRLKYQAVPLGPELKPFLDAIDRSVEPAGARQTTVSELASLDIPAHLQIYIAPQCPHCPQTVQNCSRWSRLMTISPSPLLTAPCSKTWLTKRSSNRPPQ